MNNFDLVQNPAAMPGRINVLAFAMGLALLINYRLRFGAAAVLCPAKRRTPS